MEGITRGVMIGGNMRRWRRRRNKRSNDRREHEEVEGITRGVMIGGNEMRWRV